MHVTINANETQHRIVLVDDHELVRQALAVLINQEHDLRVCAEAEDAENAHGLIAKYQPDLIILDIILKGSSGLDLLGQIRASGESLPVLMLSMHDETFYVERALKAGANGYLKKRESVEHLILAIRTVLEGEVYLDREFRNHILKSYFSRKAAAGASPFERLSKREFEILQLLGRGKENREIAASLCLSIKTVEAHRANIKRKLSLKSNTELLQYALQTVNGAQH